MPSFSVVAFTLSRNVFASAAVGLEVVSISTDAIATAQDCVGGRTVDCEIGIASGGFGLAGPVGYAVNVVEDVRSAVDFATSLAPVGFGAFEWLRSTFGGGR